MEARVGLSLRASWATTFVRRTIVPLFAVLVLIVWTMSGIVMVETNQFAVREDFGRLVEAPLGPGLHWTLPWPMGSIRSFPVKTISTMQIGFKDETMGGRMEQTKALLWTKAHDQEFALVLANGAEVVAVNAVVYYKIHENRDEFLDYVYHAQNPEVALESFAYRVLMEQTRSATLDEVLTFNREQFVSRVTLLLRQYSAENHLGIDVIDVALVNLHPPVQAATSYLDTISASIDANRSEIEAQGEVDVQLHDVQRQSVSRINEARIDASRQTAGAVADTAWYAASQEVYRSEGEAFKKRIVLDALQQILGDKKIVLVDPAMTYGAEEVLLDLRDLRSSSGSSDLPALGP